MIASTSGHLKCRMDQLSPPHRHLRLLRRPHPGLLRYQDLDQPRRLARRRADRKHCSVGMTRPALSEVDWRVSRRKKYLDAFNALRVKRPTSACSTDEKEVHFAIPVLQAAHSHLPGTALRSPNLRACKPHRSYHDAEKERRSSHQNC